MPNVTRAGHYQGWCDAIDSVRASLQEYPNGGGDILIMQEVERIEAAAFQRGLDEKAGKLQGILDEILAKLESNDCVCRGGCCREHRGHRSDHTQVFETAALAAGLVDGAPRGI